MFYSLLALAALLSQAEAAPFAPVASTQTRATMTGLGSIAALNNLVVIGDPSTASVSFSFYTYTVSGSDTNGGQYTQALASVAAGAMTSGGLGGNVAATPVTTSELAGTSFLGLGHAVAIADDSTVFVSQSSATAQTGRVVVYEGNITDFKQTQLLIPYDGKHRMDSEAFYGESISAKHDALAVGCQNCNSSAPVFSGAVYVYKPTKEGRWSESQVLTAEGVLFLGERVAVHEKVLVAAGDVYGGFSSTQAHLNTANTVVVYEEGAHGKFEQRQLLTTNGVSAREAITGVTVFDETIAITTQGSDLQDVMMATVPDKIYIYYPLNARYGLEPYSKPKSKPCPQQWTNIQILTSASPGNVHYLGANPDTSISMNSLKYLTTTNSVPAAVVLGESSRQCLSCKFSVPTATATANEVADAPKSLLTSDSTAFYGFQTGATKLLIDAPVPNSFEKSCLTISLQDQFNDGWGIASLVVTSPTGHEDRFTLQCTTANPNIFKYCPQSQTEGIYHMHIENGEETPFGWEILWKVAAHGTWSYGDRHTHMDFIWDNKYSDFHICASKGLLPLIATCEICDPNKPADKHAGKRRSLSNLRALHHKGGSSTPVTHSPTISSAPTISTTGYTGSVWNEFVFVGTAIWFDNDYNGAAFFVSDKDGKHLHKTGTRCTAGSGDEKCWVELPDGDYTLRVGASIRDFYAATLTYSFCDASVPINVDTELKFTVLDQQCYAGLFTTLSNKCLTNYKSDWTLDVDLLLNGASESLSVSDESLLKVALSETMLSVLGSVPASAKVGRQEVTTSGLEVSMALQFETVPDITAADNFARDTSSAGSLLKYELIGAQALSANFLEGVVSDVSILSVATDSAARDFSKVDESAFKTVTDHVWLTASVESPSSNFNVYAKYIAEGAYALVAVAAVLAVSLFAKRAMAKAPVVEDIKA